LDCPFEDSRGAIDSLAEVRRPTRLSDQVKGFLCSPPVFGRGRSADWIRWVNAGQVGLQSAYHLVWAAARSVQLIDNLLEPVECHRDSGTPWSRCRPDPVPALESRAAIIGCRDT